jgi:SAM-dependent methyltransferase
MKQIDVEQAKGHLLLAKMGKKVLRPGGKELTQKLIQDLKIYSEDDVVEFAPGLGYTASLILAKNPKSYTGIDSDKAMIAQLQKKISGSNQKILLANASQTGLAAESTDKVIGEAMLSMQSPHQKTAIIKEAHRILKKGGFYGIHELSLDNELNDTLKAKIQKDFTVKMKVNARPLTQQEWKNLLENEGFAIREIKTTPMHLLEPKRMIADEGLFGALQIGINILTHPEAKKRILEMRKTFKKYQKHISAISIVAQKV